MNHPVSSCRKLLMTLTEPMRPTYPKHADMNSATIILSPPHTS